MAVKQRVCDLPRELRWHMNEQVNAFLLFYSNPMLCDFEEKQNLYASCTQAYDSFFAQ